MKRSVLIATSTAAVLALALAAGTAFGGAGTAPPPPAAAEPQSGSTANGTFVGCWSPFPTGPFHAIYHNAAADSYQYCGVCGPQGQPNPNSCQPIASGTLVIGWWSS